MSQIRTKFIQDSAVTTPKVAADAITGAKIRLNNDEYLRIRNAADSSNLNILKADSNDETELKSLSLDFYKHFANWWVGDVFGLIKTQNTGTVPDVGIVTKEHATDSTGNGSEICIFTGEKPGASSTGRTGGLYVVTGWNEGSGPSGEIYFESGYNDNSGNSGQIGGYTGNTNSGNSGQFYFITGNSTSGNSGRLLLQVGTAGGSGKSGDIQFIIGAGGSAGQGNITCAANSLQLPNKTSAPTLNLLDGALYYNSTVSDNHAYLYDANAASWKKIILAGDPELAGPTFNKATFVLSAGDITNQYIDLSHVAKTGSIHFLIDGAGNVLEGASYEYTVDYTGGAGGNTRITFANDIATGGPAALIAGDIVQIVYAY